MEHNSHTARPSQGTNPDANWRRASSGRLAARGRVCWVTTDGTEIWPSAR